MAELSKLLAFMFKEDKEDILAQYNKMLDEADDEQAMLESFGSPTKLAVTISRTYKRSERKLATEADSKEESEAKSEHIVVTPVKKEKPAEPTVEFSYADVIEEIRREKAAEEGTEYKPIFFAEQESATSETDEEPTAQDVPEEPSEISNLEDSEQSDETTEQEPEEEPTAEDTEVSESDDSETDEHSGENDDSEEKTSDEITELNDDPAEEATVVEAAETDAAEAPAESLADNEGSEETSALEDTEFVFEQPESTETPEAVVEYKTNVALLILYLIFAIPIGLVLLVLAIAVTLVLLGIGVSVIVAGAELLAFAFSKLVMFADIMLCAGVSLIGFAIALILLWLGILMLVRGIKGLVGGIVELGRKACVREVSDNG